MSLISQFFCTCYLGLYFGFITLKIKCVVTIILKEVFDITIQQRIIETKMYQYVFLIIRYILGIEFEMHWSDDNFKILFSRNLDI